MGAAGKMTVRHVLVVGVFGVYGGIATVVKG
jgi:hypothetical protein